ncbi:MAG: hypothetical protein ACREE6_07430 [Limisphaerales bacterium]
MKSIQIVPLLLIPILLTGCASIFDGGPKLVHVNSDPAGAKVTVFNIDGNEVYSDRTPATFRLERSAGFLQGENYKFIFQMPGYEERQMYVMSSFDGWTIGNFVFGGLIGIGIDGATGDIFTLSPRQFTCTLTPTKTSETTSNSGQTKSTDSKAASK